MKAFQPVIILGMHRSGTSLVTQIVERYGIFMGDQQETNHEAIFFLQLNGWLLRQLGATWDEPRNAQFHDDMVSGQLASTLEFTLKSSDARAKYLGSSKARLYDDIANLDFPWGWKDPRNVWTASFWLKLFPEAKILHVYRHPVDVAASLRYRELKHAEAMNRIIDEIGLPSFLEKGYQFQISGRVKLLTEGFRLWEQYVSQALALEEEYPDNFLAFSYEDLLNDPDRILLDINNHLGTDSSTQTDTGLKKLIKGNRSLAFREDPELRDFHRSISCHPLVVKLGYACFLFVNSAYWPDQIFEAICLSG